MRNPSKSHCSTYIPHYIATQTINPMHSARYNCFAMIHKALRGMLYETAARLQQTDYTDMTGMEKVLIKMERVIRIFDEHADHEDEHILPIASVADPALSQSFAAEHVTDRQLGANLNNAISSWRQAENDAAKVSAGHAIFYAFNSFIAFNLNHMNKEENELNEVMWRELTDQQIMAINGKIAASITPEEAAPYFKWMMRSCNNKEIIGYINALKMNAPPEVYQLVQSHATRELPADRLTLIEAATGEMKTA